MSENRTSNQHPNSRSNQMETKHRPKMYGVEQVVTPEMAFDWLANQRENRPLRKGRVASYIDDRINGRWRLTHQGVGIDCNGQLIDGQHRLTMVVESGLPTTMFVVYNVPSESYAHIDGCMPRTATFSLKMAGHGNYQNGYLSIITGMYRYPTHIEGAFTSKELIIDRIDKVKDALDFTYPRLPKFSRGVRAVVARAYYHVDHKRLEEWCNVLVTGMPVSPNPSDDSAAISYRNYLMKNTSHSNSAEVIVYQKGQYCLKNFIARCPVSKVLATTEDLYPLPEDKR